MRQPTLPSQQRCFRRRNGRDGPVTLQARQPGSPGCVFPPAPEQPNPLFWLGWAGKMAQDKAVISPDLEIQPGANPKQPNRLAFRDRPREPAAGIRGYSDNAEVGRRSLRQRPPGPPHPRTRPEHGHPARLRNGLRGERRQGGKLQRQCLIPVRARHMIEIETAIDTPRPIHDPLRWGAPRQPCTSTYPLKLRPAILTTALPQAGRQEPRGRYRDATEDSSSDHLSSRTSSREAARGGSRRCSELKRTSYSVPARLLAGRAESTGPDWPGAPIHPREPASHDPRGRHAGPTSG